MLAHSCLQSLVAWLHCWLSTLCVDYRLSVLLVFDSSARLVLLLPTTDCCLRWLAHSLSLSSLAGSLTLCLRNSCLKVGMCGRYSQHLVPRFVSALSRVGYWGNVCCVWNVGIHNRVSGNRCIRNHGYLYPVAWWWDRIRLPWQPVTISFLY
jgi:hypothetical protein